jgi:hypothetical protein
MGELGLRQPCLVTGLLDEAGGIHASIISEQILSRQHLHPQHWSGGVERCAVDHVRHGRAALRREQCTGRSGPRRDLDSGTVRLRLTIAYDGRDFHGWAAQPEPMGLRTVQGEMQRVLSHLFHEPVEIQCAGRTDAGVHARGQVAHMDVSAWPDDVDVRRITGRYPTTSGSPLSSASPPISMRASLRSGVATPTVSTTIHAARIR